MKVALYIGIAGAVLAIVYYVWHVSMSKAASQARTDTVMARRTRELTRAPTAVEKAVMADALSAKVRATQNLSNLSMFY